MMLLANGISLGGLLILVVAGWLVLRVFRRRECAPCGGGVMRMLGITAIVAGIAFFLMRSDRHPHVVHPASTEVNVFSDIGPLADFHPVEPMPETISVQPDRWVFITLGAGLVILGALLFGRGGTRPVAVKAVTLLGVGAILFAVVTFFREPPRRAQGVAPMVVVERPRVPRQIATRESHAKRPSHARRPTLRPERPRPGDRDDALPPRAGEIPVSAELAREPVTEPQAQPAAAPAAPKEPKAPEEPQPSARPAEPQAVKPPEPPAERTPAEEPAKSPAPAEKPKPLETKKPADAEPPVAAASVDQPRPEWVDEPAGLSADGVYAMPVHSGVFASVPECQRELDGAVKRAADFYIDEYLGDGASRVVDIPLAYLNEHVKKAEYAEVVHSETVGQMHQIYARLEFDNQVRGELHRRQHNAEVANRLWYTGGGAALVLALLATFYGYLKLDLRTGGAHKGRLQLAATLVALIVAAGVLLVRWAVPF
jgi:hypothetical protein